MYKQQQKIVTIINWYEIDLIRKYAIFNEDTKKKKITYTDIILISYIRNFRDRGFFGTRTKLAALIGMSPEQLYRSLKDIRCIYHRDTKEYLILDVNGNFVFNTQFLQDCPGYDGDCW